MKRDSLATPLMRCSVLAACAALTLPGCSSTSPMQTSNLDLDPALAGRVAAASPSYGVGDELGLMMFSQVALAPEASPTFEVLVIAEAPEVPTFDWLAQYLALAR